MADHGVDPSSGQVRWVIAWRDIPNPVVNGENCDNRQWWLTVDKSGDFAGQDWD